MTVRRKGGRVYVLARSANATEPSRAQLAPATPRLPSTVEGLEFSLVFAECMVAAGKTDKRWSRVATRLRHKLRKREGRAAVVDLMACLYADGGLALRAVAGAGPDVQAYGVQAVLDFVHVVREHNVRARSARALLLRAYLWSIAEGVALSEMIRLGLTPERVRAGTAGAQQHRGHLLSALAIAKQTVDGGAFDAPIDLDKAVAECTARAHEAERKARVARGLPADPPELDEPEDEPEDEPDEDDRKALCGHPSDGRPAGGHGAAGHAPGSSAGGSVSSTHYSPAMGSPGKARP